MYHMTSTCVFFLSWSFTSGLWRHMVRQLYNEAMADSAHFKSQVAYEIKCAEWLTFQMTWHFGPSFDNALSQEFSLDLHCRYFDGW